MNEQFKSGFANSGYGDLDFNINKAIEQYYTYFRLLNEGFDKYKKSNDKGIDQINESLDELKEQLDFIMWYISKSWFVKLIWKIKKLDYKQLNTIRKDGV